MNQRSIGTRKGACGTSRTIVANAVWGGVAGVMLAGWACGVASGQAPPQTPAPTGVKAIATYSPTRPVTITWTNVDAAADLKVQRSTDGMNWADVATPAAGSTSVVDPLDKSMSLTSTFQYRVIASKAGETAGTSAVGSTPIVVTWPLLNAAGTAPSRPIMQGFGDGSPYSTLKFHEGVDVFAAGDQKTVAMRGGEVVRVAGGNTLGLGTTVIVKVALGGGAFEYDNYLHLDDPKVALGDKIAEGAQIAGKIATFGGTGKSDHFHFAVTRQNIQTFFDTSDPAGFEKTWLNPLSRFTQNADRDPLLDTPREIDSNQDGKFVILTPQGKHTPQAGTYEDVTSKPAKGGIDIIADVQDVMNRSFLHSAVVHSAGYWIKAQNRVGVEKHDVRSAASPYVLAKFDDNWFNDSPFSGGAFSKVYADDGNNTVVDGGLRVPTGDRPKNDTTFAFVNQFVVTNTKGGTGRVANVDEGQFWKTDAKANVKADTSDEANGVTFGTATKNAEARFKDGDYVIYAVLTDLVHAPEERRLGKLRVDNFKQTAVPVVPSIGASPYNPLPAIYDTTENTPMLTSFQPESADPLTRFYNLGEFVGLSGAEYYPNFELSAYILPHRAEWTNGTVIADWVQAVNLTTDADGRLSQYAIWNASMNGEFDVIVDYDRDLKFGATLDGLGAFTVIPEPGAIAAIGVVGLALMRRRR